MIVTSFKSGHKGWTPPWAKQVWARLLVFKKFHCPGFLVLLPSFQRIQIYRDFLGGLHALPGNSKLRMVHILVDQFHPKTTASTVYQFRNFVAIFPKLCSPQHSFAFHMIPGRAPPNGQWPTCYALCSNRNFNKSSIVFKAEQKNSYLCLGK